MICGIHCFINNLIYKTKYQNYLKTKLQNYHKTKYQINVIPRSPSTIEILSPRKLFYQQHIQSQHGGACFIRIVVVSRSKVAEAGYLSDPTTRHFLWRFTRVVGVICHEANDTIYSVIELHIGSISSSSSDNTSNPHLLVFFQETIEWRMYMYPIICTEIKHIKRPDKHDKHTNKCQIKLFRSCCYHLNLINSLGDRGILWEILYMITINYKFKLIINQLSRARLPHVFYANIVG